MNLLLKALSDSTRRKILGLLQEKDMSVGEISDCFQISKPNVSREQLSLLQS